MDSRDSGGDLVLTRLRSRTWAGPVIHLYTNNVLAHSLTLPGGNEQIEDMTHDLRSLGGADCGGPMLLTRNNQTHSPIKVTGGTRNGSTYYVPVWNATQRPGIITDAEIKGGGTTAIARTTPTSSVFDMTTVIGEAVGGGLPALAGVRTWKEKTAIHRGLGSEYLNWQFGWVPFVNDIRNFAYAVKNSSKIISDFKAGSGKNTRVGYHFPENKSTTAGAASVRSVRSSGVTGEFLPGGFQESSGSKFWFNGCFTYFIPVASGPAGDFKRFEAYASKLLGVELTPEVLWNLSPWSWALDWFGNTGDVLHNLSALGSDGLVLKYGYVMYHNYSDTYTWQQPGSVNGISYAGGNSRHVSEVKKRFGASPYSLFAAPTDLTVRQSAILAALGLTKF